MPTFFNKLVPEKSTVVVQVSFTDENGDLAIPNSGLNWTLTDKTGEVINLRSAVSIAPASTINIVLSGDDLALSSVDSRKRVLTVQGTYTSTLGSNLPLIDQVEFEIYNLDAIS